MIRLWLDDERDPRDPKIQRDFGAEGNEVWVKTASVAINRLKSGDVASISLDHDLGIGVTGSGMDVAKWIEEQAFHGTLPRLEWSVHSMNPVGAKQMMHALMNAERFWDQHEAETDGRGVGSPGQPSA